MVVEGREGKRGWRDRGKGREEERRIKLGRETKEVSKYTKRSRKYNEM